MRQGGGVLGDPLGGGAVAHRLLRQGDGPGRVVGERGQVVGDLPHVGVGAHVHECARGRLVPDDRVHLRRPAPASRGPLQRLPVTGGDDEDVADAVLRGGVLDGPGGVLQRLRLADGLDVVLDPPGDGGAVAVDDGHARRGLLDLVGGPLGPGQAGEQAEHGQKHQVDQDVRPVGGHDPQ